ncbi:MULTISPECIES: VWA domain-containing protein [unclassified Corynebacterium]|uniref:VWA domain-containing protein n=1 Tax=unclassified Corynebacterium TaxID=2624378 RepID=UPI000A45BB5F|nr:MULTISPECIES: VWA domain-containing protein [unclassified Corynebacterium]
MKAISPPLSSPQGLLRGVFAILAVLVIAFLSPASVPAFAQNPTGVTSSAEPSSEAVPNGGAADSQSGATMLVLDSSGSMNVQDAGGQTRLDAAKDATKKFVSELGGTIPLGLVTYGGTVDEAPENQEAGCQDIHVVSGPKEDVGDSFTGPN